jgi:hypothetical protein
MSSAKYYADFSDQEKEDWDRTAGKIDDVVEGKQDAELVTFDEMKTFLELFNYGQPPEDGWVRYCLKSVNVEKSDDCFYK